MRTALTVAVAAGTLLAACPASAQWEPGSRVLLDAHNCYPTHGEWADRIERALAVGTPLAMEQDLIWYTDPRTGRSWSVVAHDEPGRPALGLDGSEPTLERHFFQRIRPIVEASLREGRKNEWPLITLNLDFKSEEPEHLAAVWGLLVKYRAWLTTAPRVARADDVQPLSPGPVLVLTGESDTQRRVFHDTVPVGESLLVFGAARPEVAQPVGADGLAHLTPGHRTNYHRWWNNPWSVVEPGGQPRAGDWTRDDDRRLREIVDAAHRAGLWIRFYTLNGHEPADRSGGWSPGYNFGSAAAAAARWKAAVTAGVDFVATDQYEEFGDVLQGARPAGRWVTIDGELTEHDYERLFERAFTVPPGTERIEVSLDYTGAAERTVLDLGLRGPGGFRGWSGGGPQTINVSELGASYGYLPGRIEPGQWAVVLGVPNIRPGRVDRYRLRIRLDPAVNGPAVVSRTPGWYVGDLHTHSGHSDGRSQAGGERVPASPASVFDAARLARLDFVALTDHNTVSHWLEVDRLQPAYSPLLLLHGRELTTYRGHATIVGERRFHEFRLATPDISIAAVLAPIAADGAFVSINHPALPDDERCMGCGWNDTDPATLRHVHGVEVVNGDADDLSGWRFWASRLNEGARLAAVAGSDDHTPDDDRDRAVGRPATVVSAEDRTEPAIVDALRAGRTYVRVQGATGPALDLSAEREGHRVGLGGEIAPGAVTLRVHISGADAGRLDWVLNGAVLASVGIPVSGELTRPCTLRPGDWVSVIVRDHAGRPAAISSAIYTSR